MNKKYMVYAGIFVAGVILAPRVKSLPGFNKLPSI